MKLKLVRLANIFNPSFHRSFAIFFAVIAIGTICSKFRLDFVFPGLISLLIYSIISPIFGYPKYIEFYDNRICYVSPKRLIRKRGNAFISTKIVYQVTDITEFKIEQSKIERLFGLAHIVFIGKTILDAGKYTDRFQPKDVHCVYGILYNKHKDNISVYCKSLNLSNEYNIKQG